MDTQQRNVMFYFDSPEKLKDFDSFRVKAIYTSHMESESQRSAEKPAWYSVIGHLRPEVQFEYPEFPVADFPHESYARTFAAMCEKCVHDGQAYGLTG